MDDESGQAVSPTGSWRVGDPAPDPLPVTDEASVTASWQGDEPVVSVLCTTYQHGDAITDALRGFVGQRTTFPFEVLVRDDASTDGTAEIVAEYAQKFPNVVRPFLEAKNRWRDVDRPRLRWAARGRYIAKCEGDDYWIDPNKLQRQVATLDRHPEAVLSHHQAVIIEDGVIVSGGKLPVDDCRDYTSDELRRAKMALTMSLVFRNVRLEEHPMRDQILNGDMFLLSRLGEYGSGIYQHDVLPAVYRRHPGGVYSALPPIDRAIAAARSHFWIGQFHAARDPDLAEGFFARSLDWYLRAIRAAGADPVQAVASHAYTMRALMRLDGDKRPEPLRRIVRERDDARADALRLRRDHDELVARRSVRWALRIAQWRWSLSRLLRSQR